MWNSKVLGRAKETAPVSRRLVRVCLILVPTVCWLLGIEEWWFGWEKRKEKERKKTKPPIPHCEVEEKHIDKNS